jgi:hypothetical protein
MSTTIQWRWRKSSERYYAGHVAGHERFHVICTRWSDDSPSPDLFLLGDDDDDYEVGGFDSFDEAVREAELRLEDRDAVQRIIDELRDSR